MKNSIFTLILLCCITNVLGQTSTFGNDLALNPFYDGISHRDIAMLDNDVYFFRKDGSDDKLYVDKYEQSNSTWYKIDSVALPSLIDFKVRRQGNTLFIMTNSNGVGPVLHKFLSFKFTISNNLDPIITSQPVETIYSIDNGNWQYELSSTGGQMLVTSGNATETYFSYIDATGAVVNSEIGSLLGSGSSVPEIQMIGKTTTIFIYSYKADGPGYGIRISCPMNSIGNFVYDSNFGLVGQYNIGSVTITNKGIVLGDRAANHSYLDTLDALNTNYFYDFNTSTPEATTDQVYIRNNGDLSFATTNDPNGYAFAAGTAIWQTGSASGKVRVVRKQYAAPAQPLLLLEHPNADTPDATTNSFGVKLALDNGLGHLALEYFTGTSLPTQHIQVYSSSPYIVSADPTSSICSGPSSLLFEDFQVKDNDGDLVSLAFGTSINVTSVSAEYLYTDGSGISHFKIFGQVINTNSSITLTLTATDGYVTSQLNVPVFNVSLSTLPATLAFSPASGALKFCDNENNLALSQFVNTPNGSFKLNGIPVVSGFVNVDELVSSTGTIQYNVQENGCSFTINGNYEVVAAPIMGLILATGTCNSAIVDATSAFVPGAGSNPVYQWNNGVTSAILGNVPSGDYTCMVIDDNKCKATGTAIFSFSDFIVADNSTDPSCSPATNGVLATNGSIQLIDMLANPLVATIVWSNGMSGNSISGLGAGTYVAYITSPTGCELTYSVTLSPEFPEPEITLSETIAPNCITVGNAAATASLVPIVPASGSYTYAWTSAGLPIATALSAFSLVQGNYQFKVSNGGCNYSKNIDLNGSSAMQIFENITLPTCGDNDGKIELSFLPPLISPTETIANIDWINSAEVTPSLTNLSAGTYSVAVTSNTGCISTKTFILSSRAPLEQPVCMVGVDTLTTTNLVVWEKVQTSGINHYNIYREDLSAGTFNLIDTVEYTNASVFNDVIAGADNRSWRYRVSAVNECNVEGPISVGHKTVHLYVNYNTPGLANLTWDNYEGFEVAQYRILRRNELGLWSEIGFATPGQLVYTDNIGAIPLNEVDYIVAPDVLTQCIPTKANSYRYSRSNKRRGETNPGEGTGDSNNDLSEVIGNDFNVHPNPTTSEFLLMSTMDEQTSYSILDQSGKTLVTGKTSGTSSTIQITHLTQGIYFLRLENSSKTIKLINQ